MIAKILARIDGDYATRMRPYAGEITLLRVVRHGHNLRAGRYISALNGLETWAQGALEVVAVEGMHLEILHPPNVETIAAAMSDRLR